MAVFERDWANASVSFQELGSTWNFKRVGGKPCAPFHIYQIRPLDQVRVFLTLADPQRAAYYLEAHRKQGTPRQNAAIERCLQRAKRIWKEGQS